MNSAALSLMLRGGHLAQFSGKAKFLPALQVVYTIQSRYYVFVYSMLVRLSFEKMHFLAPAGPFNICYTSDFFR